MGNGGRMMMGGVGGGGGGGGTVVRRVQGGGEQFEQNVSISAIRIHILLRVKAPSASMGYRPALTRDPFSK